MNFTERCYELSDLELDPKKVSIRKVSQPMHAVENTLSSNSWEYANIE